MTPPLQYTLHFGAGIAPYVKEVAAIRIRGFRDFPYLYAGSAAYEEAYLSQYLNEPRAMLIRVRDAGETIAVATATPLACSCDIVADAPALLRRAGFVPEAFFYYAEILVDHAYRGRGIARRIYEERERAARSFGYTSLCLASVQRPEDHPLKPRGYVAAERIWIRDGFRRTGVVFPYGWPTIQPDGSVVEQDNPLEFWVRDL